MDFLFEQFRDHLVDVHELMDLEHVPLDDVVLVLRRTRVNLQPLRHFHVQQRIRRHQRAAVRREVLVMWNQRLIDLMVGRQKVSRQVRMVQLGLPSYVTGNKNNSNRTNATKPSNSLVVVNALLVLDALPEQRHAFALQRVRPVGRLSIVVNVIFPPVAQRVVDRPARWKWKFVDWLLMN